MALLRRGFSNLRTLEILLLAIFFGLGVTVSAPAQSLEKLESIVAKAKDLDDFLFQPQLREEYFKALQAYQHRDRFRCVTYEKILDKVRLLRNAVPGFKERVWEPLKLESVRVTTVADKQDLFATAETRNAFELKPVPRRFHAIWNDPSSLGCLSDSCDKNDSGSPDRWAVLLKDSEVYYVEKNGIYTDLSLSVIFLKKGDQSLAYLAIGGGPGLHKAYAVEDPQTKLKHDSTLLETWMLRMRKRGPQWKTFALLNRSDRKLVQRGTGNLFPKSTPLGSLAEYAPLDSAFAEKVELTVPRPCLTAENQKQKGNLILSGDPKGTDPAIPNLALLSPLLLGDTQSVTKALGEVTPLSGSAGPFGDLSPSEKETVMTTISKIYRENTNPETRARAATVLGDLGRSPRSAGDRSLASDSNLPALLAGGLNDPSALVRDASALGLVQLGQPNPAALNRITEVAGNGAGTAAKLPPALNQIFRETASDVLGHRDLNRVVNQDDARSALDRLTQLPPAARERSANEIAKRLADPTTSRTFVRGILKPAEGETPEQRQAREEIVRQVRENAKAVKCDGEKG